MPPNYPRDHPFYAVANIAKKVIIHESSYLNSDDLAKLGVEVTAMDIETGAPADSGPQFCDLYPTREFDIIFQKVNVPWPTERKEGVYRAALQMLAFIIDSYKRLENKSKYVWRRMRHETLYETIDVVCKRMSTLWYCRDVFDTLDLSIPHLGTVVIDDVPLDDRILRSEMCCLTFLMAGRLRDREYQAHKIVPVFVYSIAGRDARVVQAYYDNGKFTIRKTSHISFEKKNIDGMKLFFRWIMNIPKGETIRASPVIPATA